MRDFNLAVVRGRLRIEVPLEPAQPARTITTELLLEVAHHLCELCRSGKPVARDVATKRLVHEVATPFPDSRIGIVLCRAESVIIHIRERHGIFPDHDPPFVDPTREKLADKVMEQQGLKARPKPLPPPEDGEAEARRAAADSIDRNAAPDDPRRRFIGGRP